MDKVHVLNTGLYNAMRAAYGSVRLYKSGETARYDEDAGTALDGGGDSYARDVKGGERYVVDCPYCGRNDRLWVSYLAGAFAEGRGRRIRFPRSLVICHGCLFQRDTVRYRDSEPPGGPSGCANSRIFSVSHHAAAERTARPPRHCWPVPDRRRRPGVVTGYVNGIDHELVRFAYPRSQGGGICSLKDRLPMAGSQDVEWKVGRGQVGNLEPKYRFPPAAGRPS